MAAPSNEIQNLIEQFRDAVNGNVERELDGFRERLKAIKRRMIAFSSNGRNAIFSTDVVGFTPLLVSLVALVPQSISSLFAAAINGPPAVCQYTHLIIALVISCGVCLGFHAFTVLERLYFIGSDVLHWSSKAKDLYADLEGFGERTGLLVGPDDLWFYRFSADNDAYPEDEGPARAILLQHGIDQASVDMWKKMSSKFNRLYFKTVLFGRMVFLFRVKHILFYISVLVFYGLVLACVVRFSKTLCAEEKVWILHPDRHEVFVGGTLKGAPVMLVNTS